MADKKRKINADIIAKTCVVLLIAVMVGAVLINMFGESSQAGVMGAMAGSMGMGGPGGSGSGGGSGPSGSSGGAPGGMPGTSSTQANVVTVSAKTITPESIQETIKRTGDVESATQTKVYANASGKITRVLISLGSNVRQGDIVAYVDPSTPGTSFAESPVYAPTSGTVIALNVHAGDTINTTTEIAEIGSLTDLQITVLVAERYANYLHVGLPAYIEVSAAPDEIFKATVSQVSPVVNSSNRTIETTLTFDRFDARIKPGMYASVNLVIHEADNTIVVPRTAVKAYTTDENVAYIIEDDMAKMVYVTTGLENDVNVQILSGLSLGDVVITAGSVTDGSDIRISGTY